MKFFPFTAFKRHLKRRQIAIRNKITIDVIGCPLVSTWPESGYRDARPERIEMARALVRQSPGDTTRWFYSAASQDDPDATANRWREADNRWHETERKKLFIFDAGRYRLEMMYQLRTICICQK